MLRLHPLQSCFGAAVLAALTSAVITGRASAADEEWRSALRQQLQSKYGCRLESFVFENQVPLGGEFKRDGRIRCADGREIDYTQSNVLLKFDLRLCMPTVC